MPRMPSLDAQPHWHGAGSLEISQHAYLTSLGDNWVGLGMQGAPVVGNGASHALLDVLPNDVSGIRRALPAWTGAMIQETLSALWASGILVASGPAPPTPLCASQQEILAAWFHMTEACNLACAYCYAPRRGRTMSLATAKRAVDGLFRAARARDFKYVKIKYAGGEPLLNAETLWATQRYAEVVSAREGIALTSVVLTNGVDMSDRDIDEALAHDVQISVSLDGLPQNGDQQRPSVVGATGSAGAVLHTLDRLAARGISPHISVTITAWNLHTLPLLVRELLVRALPFSFNFVRPVHGADVSLVPDASALIRGLMVAYDAISENVPAYSLLGMLADRANLAVPHLRTCGMGHNYMVIDVQGDVHLCQMELGTGKPVGNVFLSDPLAAVHAKGQGRNPSVEMSKSCQVCPWAYYCTGGCPRLRDPKTGRSPLCEVYRAVLPAVVQLEGQRLLRHGERRILGAA